MLVNPSDLVARAKATIKECSVTDLHDCLGPDVLLIDVREIEEFRRGHIPGAVHASRGLLEFEIHKLVARVSAERDTRPEDQPLVLYCGTGGRSTLAAQCLKTMGYRNVQSLSGGIVAWSTAGLPIDAPD